MDANTLGQQLAEYQTKLSQYGSELPGQIKEEVRQAWSPSLQEAAGVVGKKINEFLPSYYGMAEKLGGTTAADISPTKRLQEMGGYLGELGGGLATAQNYGNYLGANMNTAYQDALTAMQMGQQGLQQQYQNTFGQYQLAKELEEAEKNRQQQLQLASMSGGGGGGSSALDAILAEYLTAGGGGTTDWTTYQFPQELLAGLNGITRVGAQNGITAEQRYQLANDIIKQYIPQWAEMPSEMYKPLYKTAGFSDAYLSKYMGL